MSDTYSQIYVQLIFAVKNRQALIDASWEEELYKYISGIVQNKEQKMIAINGMPDHVHLFVGIKPNCSLSELVREIKKSSNDFIKKKSFTQQSFSWQVGFGAFSYSHSHIDRVVKYILNQKEHHKKQSFEEEYLQFLKSFAIKYEEKYVFDWYSSKALK